LIVTVGNPEPWKFQAKWNISQHCSFIRSYVVVKVANKQSA